jgi:hypothetical protein
VFFSLFFMGARNPVYASKLARHPAGLLLLKRPGDGSILSPGRRLSERASLDVRLCTRPQVRTAATQPAWADRREIVRGGGRAPLDPHATRSV